MKRSLGIIGWMALGSLLTLLLGSVFYLENRADLDPWHSTLLEGEFTVETPINSLDEYLALESRLFERLDREIVSRVATGPGQAINRFSRGSAADPTTWSSNWNRSFELSTPAPRAGVLLLHGMSDSPYSLRALGTQLNTRGAWVLGLRLPGHGTAPSGLTTVRWQDMAAAVELAMRHLQSRVDGAPIYIVGYSAGGALAIHYALHRLAQRALPEATGLVLISPAIGVSPLAALAIWQARLGHLLGLNKLQWSDIKLEYDPFNYNSFAVNAGDQVYRITTEISRLLQIHRGSGRLAEFPPVLAFQSSVDSTVSTSALVDGLLAQLEPAGHELMLFGINRHENLDLLLQQDPMQAFGHLLEKGKHPFSLSVLTNRVERGPETRLLYKTAGQTDLISTPLPYTWPDEVYSLSHVALPFSREDPLYGDNDINGQLQLGDVALRGERGVIRVPPADMLRQRWNPFYPLLADRVENFMGLDNEQ